MNRESPDWGTTGRSRKKEALPGESFGLGGSAAPHPGVTPATRGELGPYRARTYLVPLA